DDFKVEGEKIGENNFIAIFENTTDDNSDQNDGVQIIAGHTSYDSDHQSGFLRFVRPDGQQCGRVRQEGGGSVRYATSSDIRLKENIQPTQYGLADILNIQVQDYNFINDKEEYQQTGFLAQQLYTIFPTAVEVGGNDVKNDPWTVDYGSLTPLLVKGMQEQQEIIKKLEETTDQQQQQIQQQRAEIQHLQAQLEKVDQLESMLEALQAQVKLETE
ncbi:MAG: tail fiber domain-containing protein, partial [Bacteroidota bacterium]